MNGFDLLVIGGGLIGSALAWGAAAHGARVALLDEGDTAFRAARGNFGLVWVQSKGAGLPPYAHWTRRSARLWPDLARALREETGIDVALRQPGGLTFCLSEAEMAARAARIAAMAAESGDIGTRLLDRAEVRAMVPGLGDRVAGAAFCPMDGHANPLALLRALQAGLQARGGAYLPGRLVEAIDPVPGGFAALCGGERFTGERVVVAAGLGSARLAPMLGLDMPVRPLRGQILVTERLRRFLDYPTHVIRQTEEGSVMCGDSQEEAGYDAGTTLPVAQDIAARAVTVFPALAAARVVRMWGALRVMTPDGFPVYAESERHPGAFAATCHSGVTLAAAHAMALAPALLAGRLPEDLAAFSPTRFHVPAH